MDSRRQRAIANRSKQRESNANVRIFRDFTSENTAETLRRANLSVEQRLDELATLRARIFGDDLHKPMTKIATWEYLD